MTVAGTSLANRRRGVCGIYTPGALASVGLFEGAVWLQVGCRQPWTLWLFFSSMSTHMQNALPYHTSRFATLAFPESGALPKRRGWPSCNMLYSQPLRARTNRSRMSMRSMHWRTHCTKKRPAHVLTTRRTLERLSTAINMRFCCDPAGQALRARCTFRHRQA